MAAADTDFADLVARVKAGDDLAMKELMRQYEGVLLRTASALVGRNLQSSIDSVDLVQSVQLMLWLGLRTGKFSIATPKHWLALATLMLRRKVARHCRKVPPQLHVTIDGSLSDTLTELAIFTPPGDSDPGRAVEFDDLAENLLGQLDGLDREMLRLRFQGYSTADVARKLNLDAGVLRVRLGRLRTRFAHFRQVLTDAPLKMPTIDEAVD